MSIHAIVAAALILAQSSGGAIEKGKICTVAAVEPELTTPCYDWTESPRDGGFKAGEKIRIGEITSPPYRDPSCYAGRETQVLIQDVEFRGLGEFRQTWVYPRFIVCP